MDRFYCASKSQLFPKGAFRDHHLRLSANHMLAGGGRLGVSLSQNAGVFRISIRFVGWSKMAGNSSGSHVLLWSFRLINQNDVLDLDWLSIYNKIVFGSSLTEWILFTGDP